MKNPTIQSILFIFSLVFSAVVFAGDPIYTGTFNNKAAGGFDVVSYFQGEGNPVKGSKEFKTEWKGAQWFFSSKENLDTFKKEPEKYAPQYGGYCAWAAAQGNLAKGDPKVYHIENGKLYLNYNKSIKKKWFPERASFIEKADEVFPTLID